MINKQCPRGSTSYAIRRGDNFYNLSLLFNTTPEELRRLNPNINPYTLNIGDYICVPFSNTNLCSSGIYYTVRPRDTIFLILSRFNITLPRIIELNPYIDIYKLVPGQRLCLPISFTPHIPPSPTPCNGTIYIVKRNERLSDIAKRFDVSIRDIIKANPGVNPDLINEGQRLCIPNREQEKCPYGGLKYTIKPQDYGQYNQTIVNIAQKFNTTVQELLRLNPGLSRRDYVVGVTICVPRRRDEY